MLILVLKRKPIFQNRLLLEKTKKRKKSEVIFYVYFIWRNFHERNFVIFAIWVNSREFISRNKKNSSFAKIYPLKNF